MHPDGVFDGRVPGATAPFPYRLRVCWDGGTFDIGMATLSAAAERNEDVLYICYDNEIYGNTGGQRSGATPLGAGGGGVTGSVGGPAWLGCNKWAGGTRLKPLLFPLPVDVKGSGLIL